MKAQIIAQISNSNTQLPKVSADEGQLQNILAVVFGVAAAFAILTIVIAGFNFVTSDGDAEKISRSKKAIIYALIGLLIAIAAEVIVLTVIGNV